MNERDQIKAISELDGWRFNTIRNFGHYPPGLNPLTNLNRDFEYKPYLTSRDAIVPVIEKCINKNNVESFGEFVAKGFDYGNKEDWECALFLILAPPNQLCEALLRATGKWK